jgi:hypothetical protein
MLRRTTLWGKADDVCMSNGWHVTLKNKISLIDFYDPIEIEIVWDRGG